MPSAVLERHSAFPCAALRAISVAVTRKLDRLEIAWRLEGEIGRLRIPPPREPRMAERLWQHTCCEVFIAPAQGQGYHEFNFSPSGEWAAYRFARYREGIPFVGRAPKISVTRGGAAFELAAQVALPVQGRLRLGLSAVIEQADGTLSYWALRHPPGKPDFHHRDAFALELDEVRH